MADIPGPRNMAEIREDILTDIVLEASRFSLTPNVGPGSDEHIMATGVAGCAMLLHARIDGTKDACTPLRARGTDLLRHKESKGVPDANPSQAGGKIRLTVTGTATVPDGQPGTLPNGMRFSVVGSHVGVTNGTEVDVLVDRAGAAGNTRSGTLVTLLAPPTNVSQEAYVSEFEPLTGGYEQETEERLRERVLNATQTNPGGGNWGQLRQIALDTSPGTQMAFVYPTMGGPGQQKVVPLRKFDRDALSFSRVFPDSTLDMIRSAIHAEVSTGVTTVVQASADEPVDVTLLLELPDSALAGGPGEGWLDVAPWPQVTSPAYATVTSVSAAGIVLLNAATATSPVAGQTRVAWWSTNDMRFHVRTVITVTGGTGAWYLTPETAWVDETGQGPAVGDYMCPAAENLADYANTWLAILESLGTGENTADSQLIANGRGLRHPLITQQSSPYLKANGTKAFQLAHAEISDISYGYRSKTAPTVPATIADAPNVLTPRKFAVYPAP